MASFFLRLLSTWTVALASCRARCLRVRGGVNPSPSPQPSPIGRGGRPMCSAGCIDLNDRVDCGFSAHRNRQRRKLNASWIQRTSKSAKPKSSNRSWIHRCAFMSAYFLNIPQSVPSPIGRGGRPMCSGGCIDLNDRVDCGFSAHRNRQRRKLKASWIQRTSKSAKPKSSNRSWIHRCTFRSAYFLNFPQSVPSPLGRGLG